MPMVAIPRAHAERTVTIELTLMQMSAMQQFLDLAIQKEGLRVAESALAINKVLTDGINRVKDSFNTIPPKQESKGPEIKIDDQPVS
jgi:hypothetical protein